MTSSGQEHAQRFALTTALAEQETAMNLETERLILEPITLELVEAVLAGDRARSESLAQARFPASGRARR